MKWKKRHGTLLCLCEAKAKSYSCCNAHGGFKFFLPKLQGLVASLSGVYLIHGDVRVILITIAGNIALHRGQMKRPPARLSMTPP